MGDTAFLGVYFIITRGISQFLINKSCSAFVFLSKPLFWRNAFLCCGHIRLYVFGHIYLRNILYSPIGWGSSYISRHLELKLNFTPYTVFWSLLNQYLCPCSNRWVFTSPVVGSWTPFAIWLYWVSFVEALLPPFLEIGPVRGLSFCGQSAPTQYVPEEANFCEMRRQACMGELST